MTAGERELLLETARAIAELLESSATELCATNNHVDAIRALIEKIRPK